MLFSTIDSTFLINKYLIEKNINIHYTFNRAAFQYGSIYIKNVQSIVENNILNSFRILYKFHDNRLPSTFELVTRR